MPDISQVSKRICQANDVASRDNATFDKLKAFAKAHPVVMANIMAEFKRSPNWRFGDTLLIFCSCVKSGEIKLA